VEVSSLSISSLDSFPNCIMCILEMCNTDIIPTKACQQNSHKIHG
jgi:hypothetical protein